MDEKFFTNMKKGERFFVVDLTSVSLFDKESLEKIVKNEIRYKEIRFLYLISSYIRNSVIDVANSKLIYVKKKQMYSWMIYEFQY